MHKFEIPEELMQYTDADLEDSEFADDVNRLFPIKLAEDVVEAFEVMKNIPYNGYSNPEKLYMLDRVCKAAINNNINLEELMTEIPPGGNDMIDKNSPEFKQALEEGIKEATSKLMSDLADKDKRAAAKQEYENKIKELLNTSETLAKDFEAIKAEKEKIEKEYITYKTDVEAKARLQGRISALKEAGVEMANWTETEEAVADMSDKAFEVYKNLLIEAAAKKKLSEEEMKKLEEMKKKEKEGCKATASTDIVDESKKSGVLPNGEASASSTTPALDALLASEYGTKK